jgi:hypothetical protein
MRLRPDMRHFSRREESAVNCRKCGCALVVLPDDKRDGFCFDCFDPYEAVSFSP